jgi:hypothetical protein
MVHGNGRRPSQQVTFRDLVEQLDMPFTEGGTRIIHLNSGVAPVDEKALLQVLAAARQQVIARKGLAFLLERHHSSD